MSFSVNNPGSTNLSDSDDVALSNVSEGQVLTYKASLDKWTNSRDYLQVVRWSGSSYATRPSGGGIAMFIGPSDPGAAMLTGDVWLQTP